MGGKEPIYLFIIFTLFKQKDTKFEQYYRIQDKKIDIIKNKKIYTYYFLQFIPILNGHYIDIIKEIINEILQNINYFPNFVLDDNNSEAYYDNVNYYLSNNNANEKGIFYIMMNYKSLKPDVETLRYDKKDRYYDDVRENKLYIFEFLTKDITR